MNKFIFQKYAFHHTKVGLDAADVHILHGTINVPLSVFFNVSL